MIEHVSQFGSRRTWRPLVAVGALLGCLQAAFATVLPAQDFTLAATPVGASYRVTGSGKKIRTLDLLTAAAEKTGRVLLWTDPSTPWKLGEEHVTVATADQPIEEFLALLGNAFEIIIEETRDEIRISPYPARTETAFTEHCRREARRFVLENDSSELSPEEAADLLLSRAESQVAAGSRDDALLSYDEFVRRFDKDARAADACLTGQHLALGVNRPKDAIGFFDGFVAKWPQHDHMPRAEIMLGRAYVALDRDSEATLVFERLFRKAVRREIATREGMIAGILLAEHYFRLGQPQLALDQIGKLRFVDQNDHPDLARQLPVYAGICHAKLERLEDAVYEFLIGAHIAPTASLKSRSLTELSLLYLESGKPFECLAAARIVRSTGPDAADAVRAARYEGLALHRLGLDDKAIDVLVATTDFARQNLPEGEPRRVVVQALMNDLGDVLFGARLFDVARRVFQTLRADPDLTTRSTIMLAKCEYEAGRCQEAIAALESLPTASMDAETASEVRRQIGDCWLKLGNVERAIRTWSGAAE